MSAWVSLYLSTFCAGQGLTIDGIDITFPKYCLGDAARSSLCDQIVGAGTTTKSL